MLVSDVDAFAWSQKAHVVERQQINKQSRADYLS